MVVAVCNLPPVNGGSKISRDRNRLPRAPRYRQYRQYRLTATMSLLIDICRKG